MAASLQEIPTERMRVQACIQMLRPAQPLTTPTKKKPAGAEHWLTLVLPTSAVVRPDGQGAQSFWVPPALYFPARHWLVVNPPGSLESFL
jgi:hypothetical protein